jgi:hypothetical protein
VVGPGGLCYKPDSVAKLATPEKYSFDLGLTHGRTAIASELQNDGGTGFDTTPDERISSLRRHIF